MRKVSVLGAGAWGTALAKVLGDKGYPVSLWTRREEHADALARERENRRYLAGISLPAEIAPTASLERALDGAELVVLVVPSHGLRDALVEARRYLPPGAAIVSATKGIENGSLMLVAEVVRDVLGPGVLDRFTVLSGPSFAREVGLGMPTNVVVASENEELCLAVQRAFAGDRLRVYSSDDPTGVEVGGALKNVIAIAAGACDGLGFGHNTRAALITRGLAEIARLAVAKGGDLRSIAGLAGMGDLVLTCTGELSRNRTVGFEMGRGRSLADVLDSLGHVAEGVRTAKSAFELARKLDVELPICNEVHAVLYEGKAVESAVRDVLTRPLKREW